MGELEPGPREGIGELIGVLVEELQSQMVRGELIEVVERVLRRAEKMLSVDIGQGGGLDADLEGEDRPTGLGLGILLARL